MYTDDELLERLRKTLQAAKHALDDVQMEAALHAVERMLRGNLRQFDRIFAPFVPPPDNTVGLALQKMGEQIVGLTQERAELRTQLAENHRQLGTALDTIRALEAEAEKRRRQPVNDQPMNGAAKPKPRIIMPSHNGERQLNLTHVSVLDFVSHDPGLAYRDLLQRCHKAGMKAGTISARLSELTHAAYFGHVLIERVSDDNGDTTCDLTEVGCRRLKAAKEFYRALTAVDEDG